MLRDFLKTDAGVEECLDALQIVLDDTIHVRICGWLINKYDLLEVLKNKLSKNEINKKYALKILTFNLGV